MKKLCIVLALLMALLLSGCEIITPENQITAAAEHKILNSAYDHVTIEITNSSDDILWVDKAKYNIYEKNGSDYVLIDDNNDGFTYNGKNNFIAIEGENTAKIRFYLGTLINEGYAKTGSYKIEIPLNKDYAVAVDFEITDENIGTNTGFAITCKKEYSVTDKNNFGYMVINNSKEDTQITLSVIISQYKDRKWVRLPYSEEYYNIHGNAAVWSENLSSGSEQNQKFGMCLADMIGTELTPGRYRLEKEIAFDWYFAEFELY